MSQTRVRMDGLGRGVRGARPRGELNQAPRSLDRGTAAEGDLSVRPTGARWTAADFRLAGCVGAQARRVMERVFSTPSVDCHPAASGRFDSDRTIAFDLKATRQWAPSHRVRHHPTTPYAVAFFRRSFIPKQRGTGLRVYRVFDCRPSSTASRTARLAIRLEANFPQRTYLGPRK